jgi:hypothetical protein
MCGCGIAEEDVYYIVWEYPKYDDLGERLMDGITRDMEGRSLRFGTLWHERKLQPAAGVPSGVKQEVSCAWNANSS